MAVIKEVLKAAQPRPEPSAGQGEKNNYAVRFADKMADVLARDLTPKLPGIEATTKRQAASAHGKKQLDVNPTSAWRSAAL